MSHASFVETMAKIQRLDFFLHLACCFIQLQSLSIQSRVLFVFEKYAIIIIIRLSDVYMQVKDDFRAQASIITLSVILRTLWHKIELPT